MKRKVFKTKKYYLIIIVLLATAGSIFFFPMNIGGRYTCFYHRVFDHSHPVSHVNAVNHHQDVEMGISKSGDHELGEKVTGLNNTSTHNHGSILLDNYLHQYALPWWASVGLLAFGIYLFLKLKKNVKGKESSLTVNQ